jgi:hypothetical protein
LAIGVLVIAAGATAWLISRPPTPFDEAFQGCEKEEAEWRLIVNYSVDGLTDSEEFVAHFRRRQQPKIKVVSVSWLRWWEPTIYELEHVGGANCRMSMGIACGGGGGYSEHSYVSAWENTTGVEVNIEHTLSRNNDEVTVKELVLIPFRKPVFGRKGKINYRAKWERAGPPDSTRTL